jgi:hypothetical protein
MELNSRTITGLRSKHDGEMMFWSAASGTPVLAMRGSQQGVLASEQGR